MDDLIKEFLIESNENLDLLDRNLVVLEKDPTSKETLAQIFRTIHTIKGTSGFLAFTNLERLTHAGESLLSDLRDGKLIINPAIASCLLSMVDAVRRILAVVESTGHEGAEEYREIIVALGKLREVCDQPGQAPAQQEPVHAQPVQVAAQPEPAVAQPEPIHAPAPAAEKRDQQGVTDTTVRVDVALLDKLMNLAGELVLARNQIMQAPCEDAAFVAAAQRLNLITTDLQAGVMKARMQPIDNIWRKFPRVVRDLAQGCGKQVRLEMSGNETELDRTIIEAIKDPLTHLVRNAVDHGIELPEVRAKNGKPPEGRLRMRAFHESGQVNIEITDDGAGLNYERIKEKAVARGMIAPEAAVRMEEREIAMLIFAAGFSTAENVSALSGRGVGMDVVKTNIEKIGGCVEIESKAGAGTTLKIKIPLTLAIIPALIVKCGGERYAIPQVSLIELVRLESGKGIEHIHGAPVHRLRGALLPLVYLQRELQIASAEGAALDIIVLQAGTVQFGLVVDEVCDTEEIVVKALGKHLKSIPCFAGATIMGDGAVALILDVFGLAQRSGVLRALSSDADANGARAAAEADDDQQTLLLFQLSQTQNMAIPLSAVARLEEFQSGAIERAGSREVVQYRGSILPLIRIDSLMPCMDGSAPGDGPVQAVVYSENGRSVGLIVGRIQDVVRQAINVQRTSASAWLLGSTVIQDRVTDLLDVRETIRAADPSFFPEDFQ